MSELLMLEFIMAKSIKKLFSDQTCNIFKVIVHFMSVVLLTGVLHWALVSFYSYYCVNTASWAGMFTNILNLGSPFCQFINYVQFEISKYYIVIWASASIGIIAYFIGNKT